jgi:hypothetical protein
MSMLNLAGSSYDFGHVLFAVLQECEHRRRGFVESEAEAKLLGVARDKLAEIHQSYVEAGGSAAYWQDLSREVMENTMPQYIAAAVAQTRLERANYDLWHGGDAVARGVFTLGGLTLGGLMIWAPFLPMIEDAPIAFALAAGGFFWPEIKRMVADFRHSRFLNRLIVEAEKYQKNGRIHYLSSKHFDEALGSLGKAEEESEAAEGAGAPAPSAPVGVHEHPTGTPAGDCDRRRAGVGAGRGGKS